MCIIIKAKDQLLEDACNSKNVGLPLQFKNDAYCGDASKHKLNAELCHYIQ